jgi:hypothetical protein
LITIPKRRIVENNVYQEVEAIACTFVFSNCPAGSRPLTSAELALLSRLALFDMVNDNDDHPKGPQKQLQKQPVRLSIKSQIARKKLSNLRREWRMWRGWLSRPVHAAL